MSLQHIWSPKQLFNGPRMSKRKFVAPKLPIGRLRAGHSVVHAQLATEEMLLERELDYGELFFV